MFLLLGENEKAEWLFRKQLKREVEQGLVIPHCQMLLQVVLYLLCLALSVQSVHLLSFIIIKLRLYLFP